MFGSTPGEGIELASNVTSRSGLVEGDFIEESDVASGRSCEMRPTPMAIAIDLGDNDPRGGWRQHGPCGPKCRSARDLLTA